MHTSCKTIVYSIFLLLLGMGFLNMPVQAQSSDKSADSALVSITEFGDYQCPACGHFHPVVEKLKEHFGKKLEVTFKHYPLPQHQHAQLAARAAEAARNQGKFWEMHDKLYSNQKEWSQGNATSVILRYARQLDLDLEKFQQDLNARETQQKVIDDVKDGQKVGLRSTPTFLVNGEMIDLPRTYKKFRSIIRQELDKRKSQ